MSGLTYCMIAVSGGLWATATLSVVFGAEPIVSVGFVLCGTLGVLVTLMNIEKDSL